MPDLPNPIADLPNPIADFTNPISDFTNPISHFVNPIADLCDFWVANGIVSILLHVVASLLFWIPAHLCSAWSKKTGTSNCIALHLFIFTSNPAEQETIRICNRLMTSPSCCGNPLGAVWYLPWGNSVFQSSLCIEYISKSWGNSW